MVIVLLLRMLSVRMQVNVLEMKEKSLKRIERRYQDYGSVIHERKPGELVHGSSTSSSTSSSSTKSLASNNDGESDEETKQHDERETRGRSESKEEMKEETRAALVARTGGVDFWPSEPLLDDRGQYVIPPFNYRLSRDPYLIMEEEEEQALKPLIRNVKHLKKYYKHTDRLTLLRFLRARKGDVELAELMFRHMVAWWDTMNIEEKISSNPLAYYPGGICGRDRDGDPVTWGRYGAVDPASVLKSYHVDVVQNEVARRYATVHHLHREEARRLNEPIEGVEKSHHRLTGILDVKGLGWKHTGMDGLAALKLVLKIPSLFFPETLKRAIIVRPPFYFYPIWKIVQLFLDSRTVQKIVVVTGNNCLEAVEKFVSRDQIPDWLGGDMITRGLEEEDPINWASDDWVDGIQSDGVSRRATMSIGGTLPKHKEKHLASDCKEVEVDFGNVNDPKYHAY
jgi:hypothetical protein